MGDMTSRSMAIRSLLLAVASLAALAETARAQNTTSVGATRVSSTIYSIGVEWDITGDANHNAETQVAYRIQGSLAWTAALPLVRVDSNGANMLAGSVMFLVPGTTYDIRLTLSDPDGGASTRTLAVATRPLPVLPTGHTFHVATGNGGGDGSAGNPFRGVAAAQVGAQPGDTFLLHAGSYGGRIAFNRGGSADGYVVWRAFGDGEVLMNGVDIGASHLWLEGLTVRNQAYATFSIGAPDDVVVRRNTFLNNHYSVYLQQGGSNWYIADNTIVGDTDPASESFDGEGIELNDSSGHTVAHNSITHVADGVSYPHSNVDIFGNDIFDTSDDGIEADLGVANVRMWGNRIHNAVHNGISFQPQNGGPWYIIRNQIVSNKEGAFKFRFTDRFVLLHNTIVNGGAWPGDALICCNEDHLLRAFARNNLWISILSGQIWGFDGFSKDWRTDLDYDGFDWGAAPNPFVYAGVTYPDLAGLTGASGQERHGIRIARDCFATFNVPGTPPTPVPPQVMTLATGCRAIDAGALLAGVNDDYTGAAPDMGAHETGAAIASYGPRTAPTARLYLATRRIAAGETTTLSWTSTDATVLAIGGVGSVPANGSALVTPAQTTTYTLTASGPSGTATATVTLVVDGVPPPPAAPAPPPSLNAVALTAGSIRLTWTDGSSNETGFSVEQSQAGGPYGVIATVGPGVTSVDAIGLAASTSYSFRIRAFNDVGPSAYSPTATATTLAAPLASPSNLTATALSASQIRLAWSDQSTGESGFRIERSTNNRTFAPLATVGANSMGFVDISVSKNNTYWYRITAYNATTSSPASSTLR